MLKAFSISLWQLPEGEARAQQPSTTLGWRPAGCDSSTSRAACGTQLMSG